MKTTTVSFAIIFVVNNVLCGETLCKLDVLTMLILIHFKLTNVFVYCPKQYYQSDFRVFFSRWCLRNGPNKIFHKRAHTQKQFSTRGLTLPIGAILCVSFTRVQLHIIEKATLEAE